MPLDIGLVPTHGHRDGKRLGHDFSFNGCDSCGGCNGLCVFDGKQQNGRKRTERLLKAVNR
ncbi:hypothetical protein GCM10010306_047270 [Streptomyces umbrinus]|nr:hypothetical protein GCM10010306_047270 [Streptomyces umbrinus]